MTTNETSWFRDSGQFDELKGVILPNLMNSKAGSLRIWSAACSCGQEPYSIGICVEEFFREYAGVRKNVHIIGTDISASVLHEAEEAAYSDLPLSRGLDEAVRSRYFDRYHGGWRLKSDVADRVRFQQFNLLKSFHALGKFDLIFCRNVLIYFSEELRQDILVRMAKVLNSGGYLFLGETESMPAGLDFYEAVDGQNCRYYRLKSPDPS